MEKQQSKLAKRAEKEQREGWAEGWAEGESSRGGGEAESQ